MRTISFALLFLVSIAAAKAVDPDSCTGAGACPPPMSLAAIVR